jgi:hypothetical protein
MMETLSEVEKRIETLKDTSKLFRDFGDFRAALEPLDEGIELLRSQLNSIDATSENAVDRQLALKKGMADLFGMKGGIYRRTAMASKGAGRDRNLKRAEKMYATGARLEHNDSYNLTNSIVIPLIHHPAQLDALKDKILAARVTVESQREERKNQWWFWADLALLNLLAGDLQPAWYAYKQYSSVGARVKDFDSTVAVLRDLQTTWPSGEMHDRLTRAIAFLETEKASIQ